MANTIRDEINLRAYGTTEGAEKGWETRGRKTPEGRPEHEGPKPEHEGPKPEHQGLHDALTKERYTRHETDPARYDSSEGHRVRVSPNGAWVWRHADSREMNIPPVRGKGTSELEKHLGMVHGV